MVNLLIITINLFITSQTKYTSPPDWLLLQIKEEVSMVGQDYEIRRRKLSYLLIAMTKIVQEDLQKREV